ncbi:MAG: sodium-dependent transporter [Ottowia sp.]|nr:sodium-dependent transporter [Ottowia sp.]
MSIEITANDAVATRGHWSNRWAFILVMAGSAVGLGNIWRFPYMTGSNGGSAFVLVYLACLLAVGFSLLVAEIMLGRRARANSVTSFARVAHESGAHPLWGKVGWLSIVSVFCIFSFYTVVAGWVMEYTMRAAVGFAGITAEQASSGFKTLLSSPDILIFWHTVFVLMTGGVVIFGVTKGIERANCFMMPALFLILVSMLAYTMFSADLPAAFNFMFRFDIEKINQSVILSALGQAFFTLSVGNGTMIVYGSYLKSETAIPRTSLYVVAADTLIAIMAGLVIFAIVFAQGLKPDFGPGLLLGTLPLAFSTMPGGHLLGFSFFILVVFAAWTSSISMLEPLAALLIERFQFSRKKAVISICFCVWLVGIAACLSFNHWQDVTLFGLGAFDLLDSLSGKILMPLSGFLIAIFCGWIVKREVVRSELRLGDTAYFAWEWTIRIIAPIAILAIGINALQ